MLQIAIGASLVLLLALIAVVVWLAKSRERAVQAETVSKGLRKGEERSAKADKIMAEPVADELAWLTVARERLRNLRRQS